MQTLPCAVTSKNCTTLMKLRPNHLRILTAVLMAALASGSGGCRTKLYTPAKAANQEEAVSTHLAVLSVARWDARKAELQPSFDLKAEDALSKVLPNTLGLEEKLLDALAAKFKVYLPGTSVSSADLSSLVRSQALSNVSGGIQVTGTNGTQSTLSNSAAAGESAASSNQRSNTQNTPSADVSNLAFLATPQGSNVAIGLPGASVLSSAPQKDAMLLYWAAAALYQEVKLMNRYVEDAAIASNYVPYLVRLQVSIMPRKRDLPYDAYTVLSFFPGKFDSALDSKFREGVKVLPLLVTDNLESALHSRSVENMRQLALALSGVVQGVGIGGDFQKVNDELRTVLAYDFNSTFNVGRISDNSLQCRFGALNQAAARFAMIPQAHNVTLLLLVPRNIDKSKEHEPVTQDMRVIANTELVHSITGKPLPSETSKDEFYLKSEALLESEGFVPKTRQEIRSILKAFASNNFPEFKALLTNIATANATTYYEAVWIQFCKLRNSSQLGSSEFQIPPGLATLESVFSDERLSWQSALAVDNGKTLSASLYWLENIQQTNLGAFFKFTVGVAGGQDKDISWPATGLDVQNQGRLVNLAFPSPAAFGYTNADGTPLVKSAKVTLFSHNSKKAFRDSLPVEYRLDKAFKDEKPAEKAGFEFAVPATVINAQRSPTNGIEGSLNIVISDKTPAAKILLTVDKADVRGILPLDKVKQSGLGWELATNGTYIIHMGNLNSLEAVQLTARDTASKASSSVRTVRVQFNEK